MNEWIIATLKYISVVTCQHIHLYANEDIFCQKHVIGRNEQIPYQSNTINEWTTLTACSVPMSQYPDKCVIPSNLHSLTSSFTPVLVNFYGLCVILDERAGERRYFSSLRSKLIPVVHFLSLSSLSLSLLLRGASMKLNIELISLCLPLTKEYLPCWTYKLCERLIQPK